MPTPYRNPTVFFCPSEDGLLAYDATTDQLHRLNAVASLIAELCDGQRSDLEIQRLVKPVLPDGDGDEVRHCIAQGLEAGLFKTSAHAGPDYDPAALSKQLRADGKIEAAYICQFNAAEREPDNPHHWTTLGEFGRILGRRAEARAAYERYLEMRPDDAEIRHLLVALRDEAPPPRAADDVIKQLYARFASYYESNMLGDLDYQAPRRISQLVAELMPDRNSIATLDLGCGSGLAGVELHPRCARLVGIDLSRHMLDLARKRAIYDVLELAEINDWLTSCEDSFDLIVACDSLIYFGDLRQTILPASSLLKPEGYLVFTLECGDRTPYHLNDNGRYSHHPHYVREVAEEAGLEIVRLDQGYLRMEYGQEVTGLFVGLHIAS